MMAMVLYSKYTEFVNLKNRKFLHVTVLSIFSYIVASWGEFYSGESYILMYKYVVRNKEEYVIYFWQGRNSSINEKGTSAYLTVDLDKSKAYGAAVQIRVVQNKEPKHFLLLFKGNPYQTIDLTQKGRIIVHLGKPETERTPRLYEVRANLNGVHIVEVEARQDLVSSSSCFVMCTGNVTIKIHFNL
jgi:hypothetical protein